MDDIETTLVKSTGEYGAAMIALGLIGLLVALRIGPLRGYALP
jgi:hypothetical protein